MSGRCGFEQQRISEAQPVAQSPPTVRRTTDAQPGAAVPQRPGFTLVEMLTVLVLVGVFTLAAMGLFRSTMGIIAGRADQQRSARRLDQAMRIMRADAWNSYEMRIADADTALMRIGAQRSVIWTRRDDQLQRGVYHGEKTVEETTWEIGGQSLHFEGSPGMVIVTWRDRLGRTTRWVLASQIQILAGGVR